MRHAVLVAVIVLGYPAGVLACKSACVPPPLDRAFSQSTAVYYGTVRSNAAAPFVNTLTLDVARTWKGDVTGRVSVVAEGSTCDPLGDDVGVGDRLLVFAVPAQSHPNANVATGLWTGYCTGSRKIEGEGEARRVFTALDRLARRE